MSYIVKNCMCAYGFVNEPMYCLWKDEAPIYKTLCQDCTGCVIKQIVGLCSFNYTKENTNLLAKEILRLFDIEEINK